MLRKLKPDLQRMLGCHMLFEGTFLFELFLANRTFILFNHLMGFFMCSQR